MTDSWKIGTGADWPIVQAGTVRGRRQFLERLTAMAAFSHVSIAAAAESDDTAEAWHHRIASEARAIDTGTPLQLLVPDGSEANVLPVAEAFTHLSGVRAQLQTVSVDDINTELILMSMSDSEGVDVALPATFGLADLVERGVLKNLDTLAQRHEPSHFRNGYLFDQGDRLDGSLYGYQTDGDAYLMFYNQRMLEDETYRQRYQDTFGEALSPARTWRELDQQMRFFHEPSSGRFGGSLFRNPTYSVWEWWLRFHASGRFPVDDDMTPMIASQDGIDALESLLAASDFLSVTAQSNSLFENWQEFAQGRAYCNLGWGGTQKFLRSQGSAGERWIVAPLPGGERNGRSIRFGYMNWGWSYAVTRSSGQPDLAYLFCLFATTPTISALAVRQQNGFFDPFRDSHFKDPQIRDAYTQPFLDVQRQSLQESIPDFLLPGQSEYFDAIRTAILHAQERLLSPADALTAASDRWRHTTRRYGRKKQIERWARLKRAYPTSFQP